MFERMKRWLIVRLLAERRLRRKAEVVMLRATIEMQDARAQYIQVQGLWIQADQAARKGAERIAALEKELERAKGDVQRHRENTEATERQLERMQRKYDRAALELAKRDLPDGL